jgi:hypothetical protein
VLFIEHASDLVKRNSRAPENIGNLRNRAGRTKCQPLSGHCRAVLEPVERLIIDGRLRLQIQHHHRHARSLNQRQNGIRKRIRCDVKKQHIDIFTAALVASLARALRRIHQSKVDHLHAWSRQPRSHFQQISLKPLL